MLASANQRHAPYRWVPVVSDLYRMGSRQFAKLWLTGSNVECPTCDRTFSRWLDHSPVGDCPYCRSAPRHRLLTLNLAHEWAVRSRAVDLLHFAPEWGLERSLRADPRVRNYVTVDLGAPGVDVQCDITALTFADASFDLIICSHVLEHVPDDHKAISELHRVLRPDGVAYIQVPYGAHAATDEDPSVTCPAERARRFGQFDHVRVYGHDLIERLRKPGFQVDPLRPVQGMPQDKVARLGLWDDIIFRCRKGR